MCAYVPYICVCVHCLHRDERQSVAPGRKHQKHQDTIAADTVAQRSNYRACTLSGAAHTSKTGYTKASYTTHTSRQHHASIPPSIVHNLYTGIDRKPRHAIAARQVHQTSRHRDRHRTPKCLHRGGRHKAVKRGVSLEMLAQIGLLGVDPGDPSCSKGVSDITEIPSDVAQFVRTLPPLRNQVIQARERLQTANEFGQLTTFGRTIPNSWFFSSIRWWRAWMCTGSARIWPQNTRLTHLKVKQPQTKLSIAVSVHKVKILLGC